jgi:hypothetical protein
MNVDLVAIHEALALQIADRCATVAVRAEPFPILKPEPPPGGVVVMIAPADEGQPYVNYRVTFDPGGHAQVSLLVQIMARAAVVTEGFRSIAAACSEFTDRDGIFAAIEFDKTLGGLVSTLQVGTLTSTGLLQLPDTGPLMAVAEIPVTLTLKKEAP